jgi:hypothetical protein
LTARAAEKEKTAPLAPAARAVAAHDADDAMQ